MEEAKNSEQHNGLKENADKLGKLAESAAAAAEELTKLPDAEAAARLDGLMRELGRAQRELRGKTDTPDALAAELDGLKREMGYHQKRGDWKQAEAWRNDLLLALEAGMGYWREQKQSPCRTLALSESMPLQGAVRDMQLDREPPEPELKRIAAALDNPNDTTVASCLATCATELAATAALPRCPITAVFADVPSPHISSFNTTGIE